MGDRLIDAAAPQKSAQLTHRCQAGLRTYFDRSQSLLYIFDYH